MFWRVFKNEFKLFQIFFLFRTCKTYFLLPFFRKSTKVMKTDTKIIFPINITSEVSRSPFLKKSAFHIFDMYV